MTTIELIERVKSLEADNARLRRQLAGLEEATQGAYDVLDARLSPSEWRSTRAALKKTLAACGEAEEAPDA